MEEDYKFNIVCVGYFHGAGGAERQIVMLANELSRRGHSVILLALAQCDIRYKVDQSVKIVNLAYERLDGILTRFCKFKRFIKETKPDIIINYWFQSAYFSAFLPRRYRGKIIYSERGDPGDKEYGGLLGVIRKIAFDKINGFVFQSKGARDFFNKKIIEKSMVISNSVSIPAELLTQPVEREKRIVSVGRLHPQKNQKLLIGAFAKIAMDIPDYTLEIYGDGDLHDELQEQIGSLGLRDRIKLMPSCQNILEQIRQASLFILTSDYEGMPNALMEAMALGLPCISTDCKPGGARELIDNNNSGIIVPIGDEVCLAEKIKYMICHPEIAEQMATKASQITVEYSEKRIFDAWENFCSTIIEK